MKIRFEPVFSSEAIVTVATLAQIIWNEHYTPIIGSAQVDYMINKFQSEAAIAKQIAEDGFEYYLIKEKDEAIGYIGITLKGDELFLSKFYILASSRGKGAGSASVVFLTKRASELKATVISLTVNKNNSNTLRAYEKMGFRTIKSVVADIGNGFVMDDYVIQLAVV